MTKLNTIVLGVILLIASASFGQNSDSSKKEHYHKMFKYYQTQMDQDFADQIYTTFVKNMLKELKKAKSWSTMTATQKTDLAANINKFEDKFEQDFIADLFCIVLNQLPTRYIRHEVDMAFYLPPSERFEMESKVKKAINKSIEFMKNHRV